VENTIQHVVIVLKPTYCHHQAISFVKWHTKSKRQLLKGLKKEFDMQNGENVLLAYFNLILVSILPQIQSHSYIENRSIRQNCFFLVYSIMNAHRVTNEHTRSVVHNLSCRLSLSVKWQQLWNNQTLTQGIIWNTITYRLFGAIKSTTKFAGYRKYIVIS